MDARIFRLLPPSNPGVAPTANGAAVYSHAQRVHEVTTLLCINKEK